MNAANRRWLIPALLGLVVASVTGPMAGASWRRAQVLDALAAGPDAVASFSAKEAAVAATLTVAESAQAERAKSLLLGMIAAMALLPLLPFIRSWLDEKRHPPGPVHEPPLFRP